MKLKRFFLVLLSFSMILCACGAPTESESQSGQETEAKTPENFTSPMDTPLQTTIVGREGSVVTYYHHISDSPVRRADDDRRYYKKYPELYDISVYINADRLEASDKRPIPMIKVDSTAELSVLADYDRPYGQEGLPDRFYTYGWGALLARYDDSFFESKTLFFLGYTTGMRMGSAIQEIRSTNGTFEIVVAIRSLSEDAPDGMDDWLLLVEVDRADIADCTVFDAWLEFSSPNK